MLYKVLFAPHMGIGAGGILVQQPSLTNILAAIITCIINKLFNHYMPRTLYTRIISINSCIGKPWILEPMGLVSPFTSAQPWAICKGADLPKRYLGLKWDIVRSG